MLDKLKTDKNCETENPSNTFIFSGVTYLLLPVKNTWSALAEVMSIHLSLMFFHFTLVLPLLVSRDDNINNNLKLKILIAVLAELNKAHC